MGQSAEELRRDIERTRGELSGDLDAIGDRMSPGRMIERRKNRFVGALNTGRDRIMGRAGDVRSGAGDRAQGVADRASGAVDTVREVPEMAMERVEGNPLAAGAVAFGVGFLAAVAFPATKAEARAVQKVGEAAQPVAEQATEAVREVAQSAQEAGRQAVSDLKDSAQEKAQDVKDTAMEEKDSVQGAASSGSSPT